MAQLDDRGTGEDHARVPAALGPLLGFAMGGLLAWAAGGEVDRGRGPGMRRSTLLVALFACLVFAPVNAYFLTFAGDWSVAYLVDARSLPSALGLALVIFDAAAVVAGFLVTERPVRSRRFGRVLMLVAVPSALALLAFVAFHHRLRLEATTHQYAGDFGTQPVAGGPLGYALLWMDALLAAGMVITARALAPTRRVPSGARTGRARPTAALLATAGDGKGARNHARGSAPDPRAPGPPRPPGGTRVLGGARRRG